MRSPRRWVSPKRDNTIELARLEAAVRDELNRTASRAMAVLRPLKVVIENYPEGGTEEFDAINHPDDPSMGTRKVPFGRELYIERDDFMEDPPRKFHRMGPGREVRLRYAYLVTCTDVVKNDAGEVVELRCTYDPETRGGDAPDGRKVRGTIHWVFAAQADRRGGAPLRDAVHGRGSARRAGGRGLHGGAEPRRALERLTGCKLEPSLATAEPGDRLQFERLGYFTPDLGLDAPPRPCSTARSRCATPGRSWRRSRRAVIRVFGIVAIAM